MSVPFHKQTDPNKQAGQVTLCACKDRYKQQCPGEWEPGCDLGANAKHVVIYRNEPGIYLESGEYIPPEHTLNDYIKRKTEEPSRITFKAWLKKSSFVEPDETVYCWLEECWNAALTRGKIS